MKFRSQILTKLTVKYKGLSKHLLGLVADKLAAKVTEESEIEGVIDELDNSLIPVSEMARLLQQEGDRRVAAVQRSTETTEEDEEEEETPAPAAKPKKKGADDPISKLTTLVSNLVDKVNGLEKGNAQKTLDQKLQDALKDKSIPASFVKRYKLEKLEDLDSMVEEIETDHQAFMQELADQGFSQSSKPAGSGGGAAVSGKVDPDVTAFAKKVAEKSSSNVKS